MTMKSEAYAYRKHLNGVGKTWYMENCNEPK